MKCFNIGESVLIVVENRVGANAGPSVHVIVRMPPKDPLNTTRCFQQVWRADLFKIKPHEHYFFQGYEEQRLLIGEDVKQPLQWCVDQLRKLPHMIKGIPVASEAEKVALCQIADELEMDAAIDIVETWLQCTTS